MLNSFREMLVKHYGLCAALYAVITEWGKNSTSRLANPRFREDNPQLTHTAQGVP